MTTSRNRRRVVSSMLVLAGVLTASATLYAALREEQPPRDDQRVTPTEAKTRAKLLHDVYASTLDTMHHHYFRSERSVLPARAMEDIFADLEDETKIKARWIAVNTRAMSVDHEAKSDFEKKAAEELSAGKTSYEKIENGYYQRAGAIPLDGGCVGCHTKFFSQSQKTPRVAALVISIPVKEK